MDWEVRKTWMPSLHLVSMVALARNLSKVWRISYEDAKRTIDATTQHGSHDPNPVMNQDYTTNDRMLRYRRITQYFLWIPSLP